MTNAEKYINDEDTIDQFVYELSNYMFDNLGWYEGDTYNLRKTIDGFLKSNIKHTLTEDERVILKNIKGADFEKIGRDKIGGLYILVRINIPTAEKWTISFYDHLFQFIKERRRILNRRIIERRIKMTNTEKYLKEEINEDELIEEIVDYIDKKYKEEYEWFHSVPLFRYLNDFFNIDLNKIIKPTLTEDERVILRNIDKHFTLIKREKETRNLFVQSDSVVSEDDWNFIVSFNHLFQFIKERRRI